MRVQGLSFSNISSVYNKKANSKKNMSNPQFRGQAYEIKYLSGGTGYGPGCTIYDKNGEILSQSKSGMYDNTLAGVKKAVAKIAPGEMHVECLKDIYSYNPNKEWLYIADPEETITDEMRAKYNFIATERPPHVPSMTFLDQKFHSMSEDNTDYNEKMGTVKAYYSRMLIADAKEKAKYEIKLVEDKINLDKAIETKRALNSGSVNYYVSNLQEEKDKQDYFIYANKEAIRVDKEKIDYYAYKNELTQRKIDFLENIINIMNKTGDAFIQRDILAKKLHEHKRSYQSNIVYHIDVMGQTRLVQEEKEHLQKLMALMTKQNKAYAHQNENDDNYDAREKSKNATGIIKSRGNSLYSFYDEQEEAKAQLAECDKKLKELNQNRHAIQKRISKEKVEIKKYSEQVKSIIEKTEPVYQELKAYYEGNCPFSNEEISTQHYLYY